MLQGSESAGEIFADVDGCGRHNAARAAARRRAQAATDIGGGVARAAALKREVGVHEVEKVGVRAPERVSFSFSPPA